MGTLGPTATTADASSFANFKTWAGNGTFGINTALTNFGWTRTVDPNQINWAASPSAAPASGTTYPLSNQPGATFNGGVDRPSYKVNCRGTWVSGTTYNLNDVVTSPTTGASYILARNFFVTNVSVSGGIATITAANNLAAGGGDVVSFPLMTNATFLIGHTATVISATGTNFTCDLRSFIGAQQQYISTGEGGLVSVVVTSATDPSSDTTNYQVYHYEIWQSNDSQSFNVTNVARSAGGVATFTCSNRFKSGFNVVVSGLTNVPTLNGTWCVLNATPTAFTVQTGGGLISSTADSGTAVYTFVPMLMKLEYYGNTQVYSTGPWIRISFGIGGTDGLGNLIGNNVGSTNMPFNQTSGFLYNDLRFSNANAVTGGNQTSTIWQCAASGASPTGTNTVANGGRFGISLFYNRNTDFLGNNGTIMWIMERAYNDSGFAIDDYFTYIVGCLGNAGVFNQNTVEIQQRSILKPNPLAAPVNVSVVSNVVAISYVPTNISSFQFATGAFIYVSNFQNASFLNDQFLQVTSASLSLTSVATSVGSTAVYTGTITNGASNFYAGLSIKVTGFAGGNNNGTFTCTASTATTITLSNAAATAETPGTPATATGNFFIAAFTNANYGPNVEFGTLKQSISGTLSTPIAGTGLVCYSDPRANTPYTSLGSLVFNFNIPMLPVFPLPGFVGNPMTIGGSTKLNDLPTHDQIFPVILYGTTLHYNSLQGNSLTDPYSAFGGANGTQGNPRTNGFYLRWD